MAKKDKATEPMETASASEMSEKRPSINDLNWTEYVLSLLSDDEKIAGNPTTDGLRRVFEIALECRIMSSTSNVVQTPTPENEKRATVVHSVTYALNKAPGDNPDLNIVTIEGAADVYWGNCDKVFRNHPVAVAETRAEGRALRRALRLRKVVAAEEIAKDIEDNPDKNTVSKISNNQINFIDVMAQRLNINVTKFLENNNIKIDNIYDILHEKAVEVIRLLSKYQQNVGDIPMEIMGYSKDWK